MNGTMTVAAEAQRQWFARPRDQRFETPQALLAAVESRRTRTIETNTDTKSFVFSHADGDILAMVPENPVPAVPTHYAFGQVAGLFGIGASWLRKIGPTRPDLVVENLNAGLALREAEGVKLMVVDRPDTEDAAGSDLYAVTSQTYGRIWDADVVKAVIEIQDRTGGIYHNPKEWGGRPSGLYASDRDVFLFMVNGGSIVDGGGERDQLFRGFYVKNSEVGTAMFEIWSFLFRYVCGNHMIHGIEEVKGLQIRHSSGGPARFVNEAVPRLLEYATASAKPMEDTVRKLKAIELPRDEKAQLEWFKGRGFTRPEYTRAKAAAEREEGQFVTVWDAINGLTATARDVAFTDARVDLERRAGKLFELGKAA